MPDPDTPVKSPGGRDRRDSTSSSLSIGGASLDSSLLVNRSPWIPDEDEQAELDRMAAEFEEAEKFELSVEIEEPADDSTVEPGDALDITEARFATPSSVLSSTSDSRTSRLPVLSSSRAQKRKSIAQRLAEDFLREDEPKRRSLHNEEDEEENEENETPSNKSMRDEKTKKSFSNEEERSQLDV